MGDTPGSVRIDATETAGWRGGEKQGNPMRGRGITRFGRGPGCYIFSRKKAAGLVLGRVTT